MTTATRRAVNLPGSAPRIEGLTARYLDLDRDMPALAGLLETANRHDGVDWIPTPAGLRNDFEHASGLDPTSDVVLAWAGDRLVGFVSTDWRRREDRIHHFVAPTVLPELRHRGLGQALLSWAEAHVADGIAAGTKGPPGLPHLLVGWADLEIPEVAPFAAAAGYAVDHYGILMVRRLDEPIPDAALPPGLEVRPVRLEDHERIWDADTEAFRDHREPVERTGSDFDGWFSQPELDTSLWEVAWHRDDVAGSSMNFVWHEENRRLGLSRGWLEHISVRRPWRRRGLATALIVRSMRRFREMGLAEAALGADAENLSGAVRLYEQLGFRRVRTGANYRKAIDTTAGTRRSG
jgi:mycothiol synthase